LSVRDAQEQHFVCQRSDPLTVRIFVTEEAFEAIKATMPLGSVGFE
jgi:hypothetical protein